MEAHGPKCGVHKPVILRVYNLHERKRMIANDIKAIVLHVVRFSCNFVGTHFEATMAHWFSLNFINT